MPLFLKISTLFLIALVLLLGSQRAGALGQKSDTASALNPTEDRQISSGELESEIGFNVYAEQWTGDLDEMQTQRMIRVLTVYGAGRYYLDGGRGKRPDI